MGVVLAGRMGERALLVIDGQPRLLSPGQTVAGVRLLRWVDDRVEIDDGGVPRWLRLGAPAQVGAGAPPAPARELVIPAGSGGHFSALGSINGHAVRFLVDTGATMVSMGADEAQRLGLDLSQAHAGMTQTANGRVPVQILVLDRVRVGDLELANVDAAVLPLRMPQVLLGNSFLSRLQMQRNNDTLRLQLR
ncbi:MAG: retroviral-like aspartic protease family protein [Burkholderiales bacterium]|nr:retroviral-like aspartic protease family protein [Burkholderiales bacterium]